MKVCYFGTYERAYPRNAQVISCLRGAGVEVEEEHVAVWDDLREGWSAGPGRAVRLALAEARLLTRRPSADAVVVGYPGHFDLPAAKRAARGRPVVFNPLVSLADTLVGDRGRFRRGSLAARALERVDRRAFRSADLVVADTEAHAHFLGRLSGRDDIAVCFVGAEDRLFRPAWKHPDRFTALFVGKLIPLQGVDTILAAARAATEIDFRVVGSGQLGALLRDRSPNVEHVPWIDYERLPRELAGAGCALGIFGATAKAGRVIPNKAFQALACGTPLITADTPAARELLRDGESALLVPPGDPAALAAAVRRLAGDHELAERIGASGRNAYERDAGEAVLGRRWRALIEELL
ncbi:MAG TPA: glycosyltransferase [Gaiellaceae bacterium]|nr:glycosyltransferase [Gaiellaceae bacterium]